EERRDVVVVDEEEHVGALLLQPLLDRTVAVEYRLPDGIRLLVRVQRETDGRGVRRRDAAENLRHDALECKRLSETGSAARGAIIAGRRASGNRAQRGAASRAASDSRALLGARFAAFPREPPVEALTDDRLQEVGPAILVVEIIGMLPNVARQEALPAVRHRRIRVRRRLDRELAAVEREPCPPAAELRRCRLDELLLELSHAAESLVDLLGEGLARLRAARREGVPEERVIPHLAGVVEDALLVRLVLDLANNLLERHVRHVRAGHETVQIVHVRGMVLAVM